MQRSCQGSYGVIRSYIPSHRRRGGGGGGAHISGDFAGGSADPPEVGAIVEAVAEKVAHFGVFVKMRGFAKSGLVYSSQVHHRGTAPSVLKALRMNVAS